MNDIQKYRVSSQISNSFQEKLEITDKKTNKQTFIPKHSYLSQFLGTLLPKQQQNICLCAMAWRPSNMVPQALLDDSLG